MPSFEKINYLLRPNKSVERKMVCEMLAGISSVKELTSYCYIGFGSTYFADFILFHRRLGISNMISIEGDEQAINRCEFNKPYACIELKIGKSSNILPNLRINEFESIIWLDYDYKICDDVFSDIDTVIAKMKPDSFFMLSINADKRSLKDNADNDTDDAMQYLIHLLGEDRFPNQYSDKKLTDKMYLEILYYTISQQIDMAVQNRNGMDKHKVVFQQTIHFTYKDGVKMLTIGGFLLEEEKVEDRLVKMQIQNLKFYKNGKEPFNIQCPILSLKEIQALNKYLPCKPMENGTFENSKLNDFPINNPDINNYASLYRYFPNFVETLL